MSRFNRFWAGVRAELPILVGVLPFGMIYGVLTLDAGMSPLLSQSISWIVFAGSAQIVIAQLVAYSTPSLVIILTVAVVNLRHMLYSASMAPYLKHLGTAWKLLLSYLLTDEAYAVTITYYEGLDPQPGKPANLQPSSALANAALSTGNPDSNPVVRDNNHYFLLGAGLALWTTWQLSTAAGIFLGAVVPESWSLDFTLALTFIALVTPLLKDRASYASALIAGVASVLAFNMPYKLGLVTAAMVGIVVGILLEARS
jgi:predicted branched-subunit amino acid permease